jgi:hypothetical protein
MRVYPKVSWLAAWSENCKWYSSLPLGAVVSLFCESVYFATITLCVASHQVFTVVVIYFVINSVQKPLDTPLYILHKMSLFCIKPPYYSLSITIMNYLCGCAFCLLLNIKFWLLLNINENNSISGFPSYSKNMSLWF